MNTDVTKRVVVKNASKTKVSLSDAQAELIDFILFHGASELSSSLKKIHDLALYHSDVPIDKVEKAALFDLKLLWEQLEQIDGIAQT
jgi:hypothetical protein